VPKSLLGLFVAATAAIFAVPCVADDFGKSLEKWGKDLLKKQTSEENMKALLAPLDRNAEVHTIKTADGWTLVAHRYRPRGRMLAGASPVILCHGLGYNAMFWDLEPTCSFAEWLSGQGYDVWVPSLRGCGLSQKWVYKVESAPTLLAGGLIRRMTDGKLAPTGYATVDPKYAQWNLDDHVMYDVPAFIHLVKHHTKANDVTWVGHSMGGIVALCYLSRYQNQGIGKLVTVGSQVTMPNGQLAGQFLVEMLRTRNFQLAGKLDAKKLATESKTSMDNMFFNEQHTSKKVYNSLTTWASDVPSIGLLQQYMVLAKEGELYDAKKEFNYTRNMHNVQVPMLIAGGEADQLAPPEVQKQLYQKVGSRDRQLVIYGRGQGFPVAAGHNDALVGQTSERAFYPVIERWIRTGKP
jgi:pimeloyl-ACP methyl ester carboxylesterase